MKEEATYRELHEKRQEEAERRLLWLEERYARFNDEFGDVRSDVRWLVKTYWIVLSASVGSLISAVLSLIK